MFECVREKVQFDKVHHFIEDSGNTLIRLIVCGEDRNTTYGKIRTKVAEDMFAVFDLGCSKDFSIQHTAKLTQKAKRAYRIQFIFRKHVPDARKYSL